MLTLKSREFFPKKRVEDPIQPDRLFTDVLIVLTVTTIAALLMAYFNFSEALAGALRAHENFQLDEWPGALLVLTSALIWFGARRQGDLRHLLEAHQAAETAIAAQLKRNQALHLALLSVQEKERTAIAREVHDELGQYLSALRMDLHGLRLECGDSDALSHTEKNLVHMQSAVTHLLRELRPAALEELGFNSALEHLVDTWQARQPDTRIQLVLDRAAPPLEDTLAMTLYRIVQESLTNSAKHAKAGLIEIRLTQESDLLRLTVQDDGLGADLEAPMAGFGLVGISERVAAINGHFHCESSPGQGFRLDITLPVEERGSV